METVEAFVVEATIALESECDPASVGACVTVALCGHWEHDGPCRWPHNSAIDLEQVPARFRTVFVADVAESDQVRARIEASLRCAHEWDVLSAHARPVAATERLLAERLLAGPRMSG